MQLPLTGLTSAEIAGRLVGLGQPAWRGRQVAAWLYRRGASDFDAMTDLPLALRGQLAREFVTGLPETVLKVDAADGTAKYLLRLGDGEIVESVYLPYSSRTSCCLSTQVGCAAGCRFCATGQGGFSRNLTAGEIVGQLLAMQRDGRRITHVVYMGMGEPLWNYAATVESVRLLTSEVGLSARNITISTVGIAPAIRKMASERLPVTLALSLHAPDDHLRARLIPTARKWKLDDILSACHEWTISTRRNLTFEYLLIAGVNDAPAQARALAQLLARHQLPGNVNLIPFNAVDNALGYRRPTSAAIGAFRAELERAGRVTTQRMTRGLAIAAACGQLRGSHAGKPRQTGVISLTPIAAEA
ncbi:MAG: 23S rRNA (adenine(2503)-C(2))-methyltransferase RlmN [Armatimonadetes bacterium]|nr:23S rRNA (adenine(2503)-C(2))-methyltransferase RlmN [Armatimonadota bacterium]MDE2205286.1 23S rRNA (adenine(2503)-C(2))-methyltransferase RlmN [Armatimonadota bacterium]